MTIAGTSVAQADSARRSGALRDGQPSYVDWIASPTTGALIGPGGPQAPALIVRKIVAMRPAAASDCADAR